MIGALQQRSWKGIQSLDAEYLYRDQWKLLTGPVPDFGTVGRFPLLRSITAWAALATAVSGVLTAAALATVAAWVPLEDGRTLVIRNAWPQGQVPDQERVIATTTSQPSTTPPAVWDVTLGSQEVVDVTIIGKAATLPLKQNQNTTYVTSEGERVRVNTQFTNQLSGTYLAQCNQGACRTGEYLLLPTNHILGRPSS